MSYGAGAPLLPPCFPLSWPPAVYLVSGETGLKDLALKGDLSPSHLGKKGPAGLRRVHRILGDWLGPQK